MTKTSLVLLQSFLEQSAPVLLKSPKMRIADFGGTEKVGKNIVKDMLAAGGLKDYHMLDFDNGVDLRKPIKGKKFDLGICMDLLEHTSNPFVVAKNIIDSLNPNALLFVTVPFTWQLHGYPDDFWRFTPSGLEELFKDNSLRKVLVYVSEDSYRPGKKEKIVPPIPAPWFRVVGIFQKNTKKVVHNKSTKKVLTKGKK